MKTFKVRCQVRDETGWLKVHVGRPAPGFHPLKYQAAWLQETQRGEIDEEAMEALARPEAIGTA